MTPYEEVPGYSQPPQPPYTQPAWNRFEVLSCELKVSNETLPTPVDAGASSPYDRGYEGAYRISSPHFQDGTAVPITFKATVKLSRAGTSDTQTVTVTASWTMVAFNKAVIWATADNWSEQQQAYYWSPTQLYANEAALGAPDAEAKTNRTESYYAQLLAGTHVQQRSRSQILGALQTSTLTFAFTHGELSWTLLFRNQCTRAGVVRLVRYPERSSNSSRFDSVDPAAELHRNLRLCWLSGQCWGECIWSNAMEPLLRRV